MKVNNSKFGTLRNEEINYGYGGLLDGELFQLSD